MRRAGPRGGRGFSSWLLLTCWLLVKNLGGTILGIVDKGLELLLNGLAQVQGESLGLLGITLEVVAGIARKLTPGGLALAFHLLGLGVQVAFVLN